MQSSRYYNQSKREWTKPQVPSSFSSFMSKFKVAQSTPKHKDQNTSIEYTSIQHQRISQNNDSVNNSLTKEDNTISGGNNHSQIVVSALNLSENNIANYQPPNLTQRLPRPQKYFESLPSERYNRNAQSQTYVYQNKLQQSPGVSTSPFNLSIDNSSNLSFEMQSSFQEESFRKKQTSQILDATDLSLKKQAPKTPQLKISISEFRNRHEDQFNNKSAHKKYPVVTKKENTFGDANLSTNWSLNMNQAKGSESLCSEDKLSSKHSLQFKKKEPAETNSIHNSEMSHEQSVEIAQNRSQNYQYGHQGLQHPNINHVKVHLSQKHPNVSSSFTENSQMSMKKIMMNNGHKGLTQSSTFNTYGNLNTFYSQPQYPQYVYTQSQQFQMSQQQFMMQTQQKQFNPNTYYSQTANSMQSMRTSQDQYNHVNQGRQYPNVNPQIINPQTNIFLQNKSTSQSATYGTNTNINTNINTSAFYNPNQPPKQPIEYKKKITRLLD